MFKQWIQKKRKYLNKNKNNNRNKNLKKTLKPSLKVKEWVYPSSSLGNLKKDWRPKPRKKRKLKGKLIRKRKETNMRINIRKGKILPKNQKKRKLTQSTCKNLTNKKYHPSLIQIYLLLTKKISWSPQLYLMSIMSLILVISLDVFSLQMSMLDSKGFKETMCYMCVEPMSMGQLLKLRQLKKRRLLSRFVTTIMPFIKMCMNGLI